MMDSERLINHQSLLSYSFVKNRDDDDKPFKENDWPKLQEVSDFPTLRGRLMSNETSGSETSIRGGSRSTPIKSGLRTTPSGEEATVTVSTDMRSKEQREAGTRWTRRYRGCLKISEDPELVELKGFMDLGFVFTEEDRNNSRLASIVPGIKRLGRTVCRTEVEADDDLNESDRAVNIQRPYLSEAWEAMEMGSVIRGVQPSVLTKWKTPKTCNEMELKESLRWWAHAVASTARHCTEEHQCQCRIPGIFH